MFGFFKKAMAGGGAAKVAEGGPATIGSSLKQTEEIAKLYEALIGCYTGNMDVVGEHAPEAPKGAREELRKHLKAIRAAVRVAQDRRSIEETRKAFERDWKLFARRVEMHLEGQERDTKEIMAILAAMADSMAAREKDHNVRFKGIANKLRHLTTCQNLAEIKSQLSTEVGQLERYVEDMARDTQSALERLKTDIAAREKAKAKEGGEGGEWVDHAVDPETQFLGKAEALGVLDARLRAQDHLCVMRVAVKGQRVKREVAGVLAGEMAGRLKKHAPGAILYARVGEQEYLVVTEATLPVAVGLASELERRLSGAYGLPGGGSVAVSCSCQVAQALTGETGEQVMRRLQHEDAHSLAR